MQGRIPAAHPFVVKVNDVSEIGLGIESPSPVEAGSTVLITGTISHALSQKKLHEARARVTHCNRLSEACYFIGLEFSAEGESHPHETSPEDGKPDYYEILQLSPRADLDTIHRVYRLLAQRYHPDNSETGDQDCFKMVVEAYHVLSDPQKRVAYDVSFMRMRQLRWKIFDQANAAQGREGEKRKRIGILSILYVHRMNHPHQAEVTIHDLEDLLGCPREHLEFTLWYLKENGWVTRTDNGRYAITAKGVEVSESFEMTPNDHMLPSPR